MINILSTFLRSDPGSILVFPLPVSQLNQLDALSRIKCFWRRLLNEALDRTADKVADMNET